MWLRLPTAVNRSGPGLPYERRREFPDVLARDSFRAFRGLLGVKGVGVGGRRQSKLGSCRLGGVLRGVGGESAAELGAPAGTVAAAVDLLGLRPAGGLARSRALASPEG